MKTPKIIFIDIDGTILNDDHQLSSVTLSGINKLQRNHDIEVVLATGRSPMGVRTIYNQLGLNGPIICLNGSLVVRNPFLNDFIVNKTLPMDTVLKIRDLVAHIGVSLNYLRQYDWFCEHRDEWVVREEWILKSRPNPSKPEAFLPVWIADKYGPNKILFIGHPHEIDLSYQIIGGHFPHGEIYYVRTGSNYLEISAGEINKGEGVTALLSEKKIKPEDCWAFGDNTNDVEMMSKVSRGIWMSNSVLQLRKSSKYTTDHSNHHDGVVRYLEKEGLI